MHLNDTGQYAVLWLSTHGGTSPATAYAFFHVKVQALNFAHRVGGDLYIKQANGELKRA